MTETNRFAALSVEVILEAFSRAAVKYKREYKKIPVLIIDNVNRLAENQMELLEQIQDFAKRASDQGKAVVVFVSSEGHVPRHMMGKLILFRVLFVSHYVLIMCNREKLMVEKWADRRNF